MADIEALREDIETLKKFIEAVERIGGNVDDLKRAVNRLQIAVDTGVDIGNAAQEASDKLAVYTNDLYKACPTEDYLNANGDRFACLAAIDRGYLNRSAYYTLNWNNPDSATRRFVPLAEKSCVDSSAS